MKKIIILMLLVLGVCLYVTSSMASNHGDLWYSEIESDLTPLKDTEWEFTYSDTWSTHIETISFSSTVQTDTDGDLYLRCSVDNESAKVYFIESQSHDKYFKIIKVDYLLYIGVNHYYYYNFKIDGDTATGSHGLKHSSIDWIVYSSLTGQKISGPTLNKYYFDNDNDGYGDKWNVIEAPAFSQPLGYVTDNTDCNDNDSSIYPGATEIRGDGIDQDCTAGDAPILTIYYRDNDNDGFGDSNSSIEAPFLPSGYVTDNTDSNDNDPNIHPEINCNGLSYQSTYENIQWSCRSNDAFYCIDVFDADWNMIYQAVECGEGLHSFSPKNNLQLASGTYHWKVWSYSGYGEDGFYGDFIVAGGACNGLSYQSTYEDIQWSCRGDDTFYCIDICDENWNIYSGLQALECGENLHSWSPKNYINNVLGIPDSALSGFSFNWRVWSPGGYGGEGFEGTVICK